MAPNSLFAVLLRSPWWISFAVVGAIALAARALLPPQYMVFGLMGGFPFLVIGVMAAWRQWRALSADRVAAMLRQAQAMSWREFSQAMETAYQQQGYNVARVSDTAADLLLTRDGRNTLVACKRWKAMNHGAEPLRSLAAATRQQDASGAIYVSLTALDTGPRKVAASEKVQLVCGAELAQLLAQVENLR